MNAKYRNALPQFKERLLADAGLETWLVFDEGVELPHFSAVTEMASDEGRARYRRYLGHYTDIAHRHACGLVVETTTWRASPDWSRPLGYSLEELIDLNREAVEVLVGVREEFERHSHRPLVISGCIGPRGDGYHPETRMTPAQAESYHQWQVDVLSDTQVDLITGMTINYVDEAIGLVRAASTRGTPVAIAFTVETDGCLITGEPLLDAIAAVDRATQHAAAYFMVNCAHPSHFRAQLDSQHPSAPRLLGVRANGSCKSHAELDEATELDRGDPQALASDYASLLQHFPGLNVLGGCCGTDHEHINAIAEACLPIHAMNVVNS